MSWTFKNSFKKKISDLRKPCGKIINNERNLPKFEKIGKKYAYCVAFLDMYKIGTRKGLIASFI